MSYLACTLVADGPSDDVLVPVIKWALVQAQLDRDFTIQFAELGRLHPPPRLLNERILGALELYPAQLLFIHRDAERESMDMRKREIERAIQAANSAGRAIPPAVRIVPVRMTEAWLLFSEGAIRSAAGNPHGKISLDLPDPGRIDSLPNPKRILESVLLSACDLNRRARKKFDVATARRRIPDFIDDFSPLRALPAFREFVDDVSMAVVAMKKA